MVSNVSTFIALFKNQTIVRIELFNFGEPFRLSMLAKFHSLRIKTIQSVTSTSACLTFEVPENLTNDYTFKAGQYLTLRVEIDGVEVRRSYSLCSAPLDKTLSIGIKRVEGGLFSNHALDSFKEGDMVDVMTPSGGFVFSPDLDQKRHVVLYAAGSGITPILSIAQTVLQEEPLSEVSLFYGNKGFSSVMFAETLEALKNKFISRFRLYHVFTKESQGIPLQKGRMDLPKLNALHDAFLKHDQINEVYVCGPEPMIHAVREMYTTKGLDKKHIHFELFASSSAKQVEKKEIIEAYDCTVDLIIDNDLISFNMNSSDTSILDAAQQAGADVPYACKGGVCCTCKAKITEGSAKMLVNYALEADEIAQGYVLTCQAIPTSERIIITFDE